MSISRQRKYQLAKRRLGLCEGGCGNKRHPRSKSLCADCLRRRGNNLRYLNGARREEKIVKAYLAGCTAVQVGARYGLSHPGVLKILDAAGIARRRRGPR